MRRRPLIRSAFVVVALLVSACGEATDPGLPSTSTTRQPSTTTTSPPVTTGSVAEPDSDPAEVGSLARLPDEESLQDGAWAAVLFHQSLDCVPETADLVTDAPGPCENPVLFSDDGSETVTGVDVPVWLVRWPVLAHAVADGSTTIEELRSLPTLQETTADVYVASGDGTLEITGRLPQGGGYLVEVGEATTIDVPPEMTGEPVSLSELTGTWESETHVLRIDDGGSYELFELGPDGATRGTDLFGFVALQEGLLIFPSGAGPGRCSGETGVYFGEVRDGELYLAAVDEPCAFRQEAFEAPWSLPSAG